MGPFLIIAIAYAVLGIFMSIGVDKSLRGNESLSDGTKAAASFIAGLIWPLVFILGVLVFDPEDAK